MKSASMVRPGSFEPEKHFYSRVLNAQIHPIVRHFLALGRERIVNRYCHLHPGTDRDCLQRVLKYECKQLRWAGADLINVAPEKGLKKMVVIETNSCPSGQKSMPLRNEDHEQGGYASLVEKVFAPYIKGKKKFSGNLAVIYDKNQMEASGYAAAMADYFEQPVFLTTFYDNEHDPSVRFREGYMEIRDAEGNWNQIQAAIRYVTQKPWNRIPIRTKTKILNPVVGCLAGGRNKLVAAKAYEFLNAELSGTGLQIQMPTTVYDVSKGSIPMIIRSMGGFGVVKIPYSNAGQGVFTIVNEAELEAFMDAEYSYDQFIVQSLIGNYSWSSRGPDGQLFHVGTVPNKRNELYVADLRMMVGSGPEGFSPISIYGRRALAPLAEEIQGSDNSWSMLGTNLSIKREDGGWDSDTSRLILMDTKDFNSVGIGVDDLIDGYIQTVLSVMAIDQMAVQLINSKGKLKSKLFRSLNSDARLESEFIIDENYD